MAWNLRVPGGVRTISALARECKVGAANRAHAFQRRREPMAENKSSFGSAPIAFGKRLAGSETFKAMFREGMALVEETATYLDGDGREQSRHLGRAGALSYATESMRLTTRLMQLASWLLLQRA